MKREIYEFICPVYYLPYIFNGDMNGLTEDEIESINSVLNGYNLFEVIDEPFFSYYNDFSNLGSECVTLAAIKK